MHVLVIADELWVRNEVHAALSEPDHRLVDLEDPTVVSDAVTEKDFDAVIVDLQVGSMGGMAVTRTIREATGDESSPGIPVVILLDRAADSFLAKRAGARGWLTKPFTSQELRAVLDSATASEPTPS
jgi:DNA-binding response OmpR family regulator